MDNRVVEVKICMACKGTGNVSIAPMTWMAGPNISVPCDHCKGTGKITITKQMVIEKEKLKPKTRFQILTGSGS
jgi:DnaJ-class molecular chaperone